MSGLRQANYGATAERQGSVELAVSNHPRRPQVRRWMRKVAIYLTGLIICAWSLGPPVFIISSSLKLPLNIFSWPPRLLPRHPTLENFRSLFSEHPEFRVALGNSLIVTIGATVVAVGVSLLAAFAFSRFPSGLLRRAGVGVIGMRMFPPIIVSIPLYPILNALGMENQLAILVVLYSVLEATTITWLMKSYLDAIPAEIDQAAAVDGATGWTAFRRITIPLARPVIVTGAILIAMYSWNEFQFSLLFMSGNQRTAPVIIATMLASPTGVAWGEVFAASVVQMVPPMIFLLAVQRYLVKGVSAGAVKG